MTETGNIKNLIIHKEQFVPRVLPQQAEKLEDFIARLGIEGSGELKKGLFRRAQRSNAIESLSKSEKFTILDDAIRGMFSIASARDISVPSQQEMVDRILFLGNSLYQQIYHHELKGETEVENRHGISIGSAVGAILPNRIVLVNAELLQSASKKLQVDAKLLLVETSVHELWHSLEYIEFWETMNQQTELLTPSNLIRRTGIYTKHPPKSDMAYQHNREGLRLISEGFTEYCTRNTLEKIRQKKSQAVGYDFELQVVDRLCNRIGEDLLYKATYTKDGFRLFSRAIHDESGNNLLTRICEEMSQENRDYTLWLPYMSAQQVLDMQFPYPKTAKLIDQVVS